MDALMVHLLEEVLLAGGCPEAPAGRYIAQRTIIGWDIAKAVAEEITSWYAFRNELDRVWDGIHRWLQGPAVVIVKRVIPWLPEPAQWLPFSSSE